MRSDWSAGLLAVAMGLASAGGAGAQTAATTAQVDGPAGPPCVVTGPTAASSSAVCPTVTLNGAYGSSTGASNASADAVTRSLSVGASVTQNGSTDVATAIGTASWTNTLSISGTPPATGALVFHFITGQTMNSGAYVSGELPGILSAEWFLSVATPAGIASQSYFLPSGSTVPYTDAWYRSVHTANGYDLWVPLPSGGTFSFTVSGKAEADGLLPPETPPDDFSLSSSFMATLSGVDAVTGAQSETLLGSATFDPQTGLGTLSITTPEPNSFALLGTGLLGLVPFVRRRHG